MGQVVCILFMTVGSNDLILTLCLFFLKVLERKISTRQSREELIRRGLLKELPDQGEEICLTFQLIGLFLPTGFKVTTVVVRQSGWQYTTGILLPPGMSLWGPKKPRCYRKGAQRLLVSLST